MYSKRNEFDPEGIRKGVSESIFLPFVVDPCSEGGWCAGVQESIQEVTNVISLVQNGGTITRAAFS